ncbi:MAG: CCA tRNA nucleotidyltransferase [Pseudomonadota bacterium]
MDRPDDIMLPARTTWLSDAAVQSVCGAVGSGGDPVYFVGGCVRDALLGVEGSDVDLSTPLHPEEVTARAEAAGLKVVHTGIEHGTVTVVADGKGYEVTSFRRDVQTDGRRAVVAFSADIAEDARRRDFTLNALYATPEGQVLDPLGGLPDCLNRRIRFIEDAATRIREDYLRILRFFRFHAWYAETDAGFDPDALDAIAANADGLETLSAERVGSEIIKLLGAPDPAPAMAVMRQTGCLVRILPGSDDRFLAPVIYLETMVGLVPDPLLRLAALGGTDLAKRLRLSRAQAQRLEAFMAVAYSATPLAELSYRQGADIALAAAVLRAAMGEREVATSEIGSINHAAHQAFPVTAADLMPDYQGRNLGDKLNQLEQRWIASGFTLTREDLVTGL